MRHRLSNPHIRGILERVSMCDILRRSKPYTQNENFLSETKTSKQVAIVRLKTP